MIVLDTNIIEPYPTLDSPTLDLLRAIAHCRGMKVTVPWIVVEEYLTHRLNAIKTSVDKARSATRDLARSAPDWPWEEPAWPDPETVVGSIRQQMEIMFGTPLPSTASDFEDAMRREVRRQAPAKRTWNKPGAGARDVLVWLAALNAARKIEGTVYLASKDLDAFGDNGLLPELKAEAEAAVGPDKLVYISSLETLIAELATTIELPGGTTGESLADDEITWVAVDERFRYAAVQSFGLIFDRRRDRLDYYTVHGGPELVGAPREVNAYSVEDRKWATFRATYEAPVTVASTSGAEHTRRFSSLMTLLVELDGSGSKVMRAQVLHSRPLKAKDE